MFKKIRKLQDHETTERSSRLATRKIYVKDTTDKYITLVSDLQ